MRWQSASPGLIAAVLLIFRTMAGAQNNYVEPASKVPFPKEASFRFEGREYRLKITGAAAQKQTRGETERNVWTIAHYMENRPAGAPPAVFQSILESAEAKQIVINFNSGQDAGKFSRRLERFLQRSATPAELQKVQKSMQAFLGFFETKAFAVNDRFTTRWLPGGKIVVAMPGEQDKTLTDPAFAALYWKVWLGDFSPVDRTKLVSLAASQ